MLAHQALATERFPHLCFRSQDLVIQKENRLPSFG